MFAFHERSEAASSVHVLAALVFEAADLLGFRYAACGAHVDPLAQPEGAFLWHNYPAEWAERFARKRYHRIDPVLRHAERTKDAFLWDDPTFRARLSERQQRLLNEARAFRLAHGYTIPLSHDPCFPASCSFVSETGDLDPVALAVARKIMIAIYGRANLLIRGDGSVEKTLSSRERQCLALKAQGADDAEIALTLTISDATVRRHIEQAKRRLSAKSREHAIAIAIQSGQLR